MNQFWNERTKRLQPYVPGEQPRDQQYIKLNTNENPWPPSRSVIEAMHAAVDDKLNLYPDPDSLSLKAAIAKYCQLSIECVFVGNGSDEVLAHIFAGLFDANKPVLCPDISYSFYPVYAQLYGLNLQLVPLNDALEIELDHYSAENGGVIFANPNAPTSIALELSEIVTFLERNTQSTVVVDEAYVDFGAQSCAELISSYPNLVVVQTVSKSRSLAGLRVGFALASPGVIEGLERIKNSFNSYPLDKIAQAGAQAAFEDVSEFDRAREELISLRDVTVQTLRALDFTVSNSATNFVFARPEFMPAEWLYKELRKTGILVRHFNAPRIEPYLRITIGTQLDMKMLFEAIEAIKSEHDI